MPKPNPSQLRRRPTPMTDPRLDAIEANLETLNASLLQALINIDAVQQSLDGLLNTLLAIQGAGEQPSSC